MKLGTVAPVESSTCALLSRVAELSCAASGPANLAGRCSFFSRDIDEPVRIVVEAVALKSKWLEICTPQKRHVIDDGEWASTC
jgi:hypothetical protein